MKQHLKKYAYQIAAAAILFLSLDAAFAQSRPDTVRDISCEEALDMLDANCRGVCRVSSKGWTDYGGDISYTQVETFKTLNGLWDDSTLTVTFYYDEWSNEWYCRAVSHALR